jgi:hypothetical protein
VQDLVIVMIELFPSSVLSYLHQFIVLYIMVYILQNGTKLFWIDSIIVTQSMSIFPVPTPISIYSARTATRALVITSIPFAFALSS